MADDIAQLIADITRSPGTPAIGTVTDHRSARVAEGGRAIGWAIGLVGAALAIGTAVVLTRPYVPAPLGRPAVRTIAPPVRAASRVEAPVTIAVPTGVPPATARIVTRHSRLGPPLSSRRVILAGKGASPDVTTPAATHAVPEPSGSAMPPPSARRSPHLTGAALERALAEDSALTRRVNVEQLRKSPEPALVAGKRPRSDSE